MSRPTAESTEPQGLIRYLPILGWLPRYDRVWLRPDLIAGVTVAALVVPKALGYASIAGVPIEYGLYAAAAGAIIYAIFGTSRQIAVGPSSAVSAVAGGAVITAGLSGSEDAVMLVASISIVTGMLFLLLALFKMGWMSQFLSKAVITGFLFGAAIEVVVGELPKLTGTEPEGSNAWQELWSWLGSLSGTSAITLVIGVLSLAVIVGLRFIAPHIPGALVLVVGGLVASEAFGLGERGVALVGDVPRGLPSLAFPDLEFVWDNIAPIVAASIGLLLIGFSQSAGDARAFASKHRYRVDINQESVAQGMCNIGSGMVQGIPVATSLSASSLNDSSGAKSPLASLTSGVMVILTLLILAPLLSGLPKPVLAALIIDAVVFGMMNVKEMRRLRRVARVDFWIAIAAIVGVVLAGVLAGVIIGVLLSLGWLIYVSAMPKMPVLGHERGTQVWHGVDDNPAVATYPGVVVLRFDAGLFFASSDALGDRLRELQLAAEVEPHTVVIDCEGINFMDSQGSGKIAEIVEVAMAQGVEVRLARVKTTVRSVLDREGVIEAIGEDHIYGNVHEAAADVIPD